MDSDEYLMDSVVELIDKWWQDIKEDECYAGISGLRGNRKGEVIGGTPLFETMPQI